MTETYTPWEVMRYRWPEHEEYGTLVGFQLATTLQWCKEFHAVIKDEEKGEEKLMRWDLVV